MKAAKYLYTNYRVLCICALKNKPPRIDADGSQEYEAWLWGSKLIPDFSAVSENQGSGHHITHRLHYFRLEGKVRKNKSALIINTCTVSKGLMLCLLPECFKYYQKFRVVKSNPVPVDALVLGAFWCLFKHCSYILYVRIP